MHTPGTLDLTFLMGRPFDDHIDRRSSREQFEMRWICDRYGRELPLQRKHITLASLKGCK